jgi:predicted transcriptional regulator
MARLDTFTFRLPDDVRERIDAYAERIEEQTGAKVSRAAALLALVRKGLEQVEKPPEKS